MAKQAVLLLAHGTPETIDQIPEYLLKVTGGRPLPQSVVEEIERRYTIIGHSPLTEITLEHARLVEALLAEAGTPVRVYVGMRNWHPYIADVVSQMKADGVEQAAVLCLAPQNSRTSVGLYRRAVEAAADGIKLKFIESWARNPLLAEAFAERLRPALAKLRQEANGEPVPVLFTAHSVPCRTVEPSAEGTAPADTYADDARATAAAVAALVPEIPSWHFAFQSQGASGDPWLGPTVEETIERLAQEGVRNLILQPIGFLCDHVEILYDVDNLFRSFALEVKVRLERPQSLNNSPTLASSVAQLTQNALASLSL